MNILEKILEKRKEDYKTQGFSFGVEIPATRTRKIVPFLAKRGIILEIKRSSPSKGILAENLDAKKTALAYKNAGAVAISVLTEKNYFSGSLKDLIEVCSVAGEDLSVLRKDFLFSEEEIEISWRCGADAVLLIARILSAEKLVSMIKKCLEFKITPFIELKTCEDLEKLKVISKKFRKNSFVCGINSRDLTDFKIDLLSPPSFSFFVQKILGKNAKIVFESGVKTKNSAAFVSQLGFWGLLLGEAAAKNPSLAKNLCSAFLSAKKTKNAEKWNEYSKKLSQEKKTLPFVKICGITNLSDAKFCEKCGANFLGFVFAKKSPRKIDEKSAQKIAKSMRKKTKTVAVIVDLHSKESLCAIQLVKSGKIDFLQLHGFCDDDLLKFFNDENLKNLPHFFAINADSLEIAQKKLDFLKDQGEARILLDSKVQNDGKIGGSGIPIEENFIAELSKKNPLWLAGGISAFNIQKIKKYAPELVDLSTSLEISHGKKDFQKVKEFFKILREN